MVIGRRTLLALGLGAILARPAVSQELAPIAGNDPSLKDYLLGPGDELRITVFNEPDLTGPFTVDAQGSVSFPLIGQVKAGGVPVSQFSSLLAQRLGDTFLKKPNVSVEVLNYRPFFILGEVVRPGMFPYSAKLTVMNAVATAGGFTYRANRGKVYIKRAGDLSERSHKLTSDLSVLPGDTVRIPERFL